MTTRTAASGMTSEATKTSLYIGMVDGNGIVAFPVSTSPHDCARRLVGAVLDASQGDLPVPESLTRFRDDPSQEFNDDVTQDLIDYVQDLNERAGAKITVALPEDSLCSVQDLTGQIARSTDVRPYAAVIQHAHGTNLYLGSRERVSDDVVGYCETWWPQPMGPQPESLEELIRTYFQHADEETLDRGQADLDEKAVAALHAVQNPVREAPVAPKSPSPGF